MMAPPSLSPGPYPPGLQQVVDAQRTALLLDSERLGVMHVVADDLMPFAARSENLMLVPLEGQLTSKGAVARPGDCLWAQASYVSASLDARFLAARFKD